MASASQNRQKRLGLVVEDQADTRAWLVRMLGQAFDGIDISEVATRQAAFEWIRSQPISQAATDGSRHVALIDLGLPDGSGIDLIREVSEKYPAVLPVVTTIYDDESHLFEAIAAGAQGYLLKDQHGDALVGYLHRIDLGEPPLSPSIALRMLKHFSQRPLGANLSPMTDEANLTAREIDVLRLMGRGLRTGEAARVLGLTPHTVAGYVKTVYRKLNISSRAEAAIEAVRRGLV